MSPYRQLYVITETEKKQVSSRELRSLARACAELRDKIRALVDQTGLDVQTVSENIDDRDFEALAVAAANAEDLQ